MFGLLKREPAAAVPAAIAAVEPLHDARTLVNGISREASMLGRDAAEVRGAIDDTIKAVGSSRVDLQACKLEYSIVSPK